MHPAELRKYRQLDATSQSSMRSATNRMQLVLKPARTIADLAGEVDITPQHLAETLQYRPKLNQF
jgi:magnesium chelatase family protein